MNFEKTGDEREITYPYFGEDKDEVVTFLVVAPNTGIVVHSNSHYYTGGDFFDGDIEEMELIKVSGTLTL